MVREYRKCAAADAARAATAQATHVPLDFTDLNSSRFLSGNAPHSGDYLNALPIHVYKSSRSLVTALQYRYGLYISAARPYFDALEADVVAVTEADRLGINLAHKAHYGEPHKWLVVHWWQAESAATDGTVYLGDKKKGKDFYLSLIHI